MLKKNYCCILSIILVHYNFCSQEGNLYIIPYGLHNFNSILNKHSNLSRQHSLNYMPRSKNLLIKYRHNYQHNQYNRLQSCKLNNFVYRFHCSYLWFISSKENSYIKYRLLNYRYYKQEGKEYINSSQLRYNKLKCNLYKRKQYKPSNQLNTKCRYW